MFNDLTREQGVFWQGHKATSCSVKSEFPRRLLSSDKNFALAVYRDKFCTGGISQGYQILHPNWVRLVPNRTNLGLLKISFTTFWLGEPKSTETDLKSPDLSHFGPILMPNLTSLDCRCIYRHYYKPYDNILMVRVWTVVLDL